MGGHRVTAWRKDRGKPRTPLSPEAERILRWAKRRGTPFTAHDVVTELFPGRSRVSLPTGAWIRGLKERGHIRHTGRSVLVVRQNEAIHQDTTVRLTEWELVK
jgi:hypothetical protein